MVIADKTPVVLVFNGITYVVMMTSPTDLEDFALGFALSEGIIDNRVDWRGADVGTHPYGLEVYTETASYRFARLKGRRRTLADPTGCGLCSIESPQTFEDAPQPLMSPVWLTLPADTQVLGVMQAMIAHQPANALTGGLHATEWVSSNGNAPLYAPEDVGHHNALNKLIDRLAWLDIRPSDGPITMTSRASFELVHKRV